MLAANVTKNGVALRYLHITVDVIRQLQITMCMSTCIHIVASTLKPFISMSLYKNIHGFDVDATIFYIHVATYHSTMGAGRG